MARAMCKCSELEDVVRYKRDLSNAISCMPQLPEAPRRWERYINYRKCPDCGQIWKVNEFNQAVTQLAIKVPPGVTWDRFDDTELRFGFFRKINCEDGDEVCLWAGCDRKVLLGKHICAQHAFFAMGATE